MKILVYLANGTTVQVDGDSYKERSFLDDRIRRGIEIYSGDVCAACFYDVIGYEAPSDRAKPR